MRAKLSSTLSILWVRYILKDIHFCVIFVWILLSSCVGFEADVMSSSMGQVEYFPCKHQFKEGKGDGCHDFDPSDGDPLICECCGCHRNYHVVLSNEESRYGACEKHIAEQGGHDGCQAFIPSTPREKYCACCSHHRSFHKPLNLHNSMPSTNCPSGNNMRPDSSSEPSGG